MNDATYHHPPRTRWQRFAAGWTWLILKNVLGWVLILAALAAGPLVPGPGGIPLFLIGFTLISFPGKRRLTARALRGRPVTVHRGWLLWISLGPALGFTFPALWLARSRVPWIAAWWSAGPSARLALHALAFAALCLLALFALPILNLILRLTAAGRRKFRPWLRRRHVHLLPPRWRLRLGHEPGIGPLRVKEEILKFYRRRRK